MIFIKVYFFLRILIITQIAIIKRKQKNLYEQEQDHFLRF